MTVIQMKGAKEAPRSVRSKMETMLLTPSSMAEWLHPPFQRPLKVTAKVREIAEELKHNGGFVNGILTLGMIDGEKGTYLIDGQHRVEAAKISELSEVIADVRICSFDNMGEMGIEFSKLNSSIVRMNPDDLLRAMEGSVAVVHNIRVACPFVGYDQIRRSPASPVLSMSAAVRSWMGSGSETPKLTIGGALAIVQRMTPADGDQMAQFLRLARTAWGNDEQNYRLWASLNLTMCMWLYRWLVLDKDRRGNRRYVILNQEQFKKCLMHISAEHDYVDWLVGRNMSERDRMPCYGRLKAIFSSRLKDDFGGKKINMPQPAWATSH